MQWYYVAVGFVLIPFMGVANSYGAGLTDQDNSSMVSKEVAIHTCALKYICSFLNPLSGGFT